MITLEELCARFDLSRSQVAALRCYVDLLAGWRRANVTGVRSREEIVETLIGDSLGLLDVPALPGSSGAHWLDLGAGAGVPGIPLAVALPAIEMTLLEATRKKCEFLVAAAAATGLSERIRVVCARSERYAARPPAAAVRLQPGLTAVAGAGREVFAVVVARALAPLAVVVELGAPLLAPGGLLVASKTSAAMERERAAGEAAAVACGLALREVSRLPRSPLQDSAAAVFAKVDPTPEWLPRREGVAGKRPLG
jgi:16S rRNA (guanine527-N7)-methyltransferase